VRNSFIYGHSILRVENDGSIQKVDTLRGGGGEQIFEIYSFFLGKTFKIFYCFFVSYKIVIVFTRGSDNRENYIKLIGRVMGESGFFYGVGPGGGEGEARRPGE